MDVAVSLVIIISCAPILLLVAVFVWGCDRGPILYRARRVGLRGRPFHMLKFRTMVLNADKFGASSTANDDRRITRIGKFLRQYKLDELPQLFNVVSGSMSLVGPRPQVQWAVDMYSAKERLVLEVQPGITDFASLHFPNEGEILKGSVDPDRDYMEKIHPHKMRLALLYVEEQSFATDVKILFMTVLTVLRWRV